MVKRIAIAGILTECNDFTSTLIELADFERVELLRGDQILKRTDGRIVREFDLHTMQRLCVQMI